MIEKDIPPGSQFQKNISVGARSPPRKAFTERLLTLLTLLTLPTLLTSQEELFGGSDQGD